MALAGDPGEDFSVRPALSRATTRGPTVPHPAALFVTGYGLNAETGEAAMWGALVVAMFSLIAGAPIMAKFWLKPPPVEVPADPDGTEDGTGQAVEPAAKPDA